MRITSRRGTIVFFLCLGVGLVALAVALNVGWIILNWREGVLLFFGLIFFALIIAGMIVNTIFLVREIRRNEQHDSFINAVTHELKTIFKRFYRVPNRTLPQVRGTGLGLFLVRTIAKRHGGRVSAQSAGPGNGSTVILELPRSVA